MREEADLDAIIDAATALTGIPLAPDWRENIRTHLAITLRLARLVQDFPLPDETEPAPVFRA